MKDKPEKEVAKQNCGLVPHQSFMYGSAGIRKIFRGGNVWEDETDEEFMARIEKGDLSVPDLDRTCKMHPLIIQFTKEGKDYKGAIEAICQGASYHEVLKNAGFIGWGAFRSMTEFVCPGLKSLFLDAQECRESYHLQRAEAALRKRAIDGVQEPVFTQAGKLAGHRTKHSDKLLEIHLKALDPDKYADTHKHEVKGLVVSVNMGLRD